MEDNTFVYVSAYGLLGKPVIVKTTHGELMDYIQHTQAKDKEELIFLSNKIFRELIDINVDKLVEQMSAGDKDALDKWDNFCADVLILHACRFTLHGKPIPITHDIGKDLPALGKTKENQGCSSVQQS